MRALATAEVVSEIGFGERNYPAVAYLFEGEVVFGSTPAGKEAIARSSNRCIEATISANGTRRPASASPIRRTRITKCSKVPRAASQS